MESNALKITPDPDYERAVAGTNDELMQVGIATSAAQEERNRVAAFVTELESLRTQLHEAIAAQELGTGDGAEVPRLRAAIAEKEAALTQTRERLGIADAKARALSPRQRALQQRLTLLNNERPHRVRAALWSRLEALGPEVERARRAYVQKRDEAFILASAHDALSKFGGNPPSAGSNNVHFDCMLLPTHPALAGANAIEPLPAKVVRAHAVELLASLKVSV